ncbi:MAG: ATP synthase F0 subunit A [Rhodospirillales bacterium CG15_BIG_FIL_POST_REV_8_21_14_020_66_15]|nr:MAG: ATP synthase F0 subunit A [Rhodospirillales bacterium CG15_BIG_FIL_POST_REV_8_21_14_020_66_15]
MDASPLAPEILFLVGPVPISRPVVTTWVIMIAVVGLCRLGTRRAGIHGGTLQTVLEITVETMADQLRDILRRDPWPFLPLLGTLFVFLVFANLTTVIPGMKPPTGHVETPAALAAIVFFSVHFFGIRSRGAVDYAARYLKPNPVLLPLNVLAEITRTFSLMIRLFGNMMSHEFVIAIVVFMAGLFLPIPFMLLGILIGIIQAYIFTILAAVFIGAAVGNGEGG